MITHKPLPYVYICTHKETGHFYIGYRERNKTPSSIDLQKYKTSSKYVNPRFDQFSWKIIAEFFDGESEIEKKWMLLIFIDTSKLFSTQQTST